ncbi:MAG: DUF456 domain-containing protein [Actinobacteria bacterium]|nr:MAG: DUF456 domain-containing protein [Actinomycetota bacterium]
MTWLSALVGVALVVALVGTVLPILPGPFLAAAAVAVWGVVAGGVWGWSLAVFAVALVALATLLKYLIPARWMRDGGVPAIVLVAGAVGGIIGFFVIPVVGIIVGFLLGVFLAEWIRVRSLREAWPTTVTAMKAAGLSLLIDLASILIVGAAWVGVMIAR